jgi:hypothetical protein
MALASSADVNATKPRRRHLRCAAALLGCDRVIGQLADAGANLAAKNARGQTALSQIAAKPGATL